MSEVLAGQEGEHELGSLQAVFMVPAQGPGKSGALISKATQLLSPRFSDRFHLKRKKVETTEKESWH